jgi:ribose transport system ATP-binding protein
VGQNGSGKSTLAKIITGYHAPDRGARLIVDGQRLLLPIGVRDLHSAAVSIVHQDLGLLPDRDVVANVRIGSVRGSRLVRRVRWERERELAQGTLSRLGFTGRLDEPVAQLTDADRARVAIARALQDRPAGRGLIVFDESTRVLPPGALAAFYDTVRMLVGEGTSVLLIAHRLDEVIEYCDRVSVLRDGVCVAAGVSTRELSEAALAATMLGGSLTGFTRSDRLVEQTETIFLRGLAGPGLADPVSLRLRRGEVLGLTGMPGAGWDALTYLLGGAAAPTAGTLEVDGLRIQLRRASPASLVRQGVVLVPGRRLEEGLGADQTVRDNIALPWLRQRSRRWAIGRWPHLEADNVIGGLGVVPANPLALVSKLSGGNQQKVLLGKWLAGQPRLLLVNEPTQAVDVAARRDILATLHRAASAGTSVILASSEASDLAAVCDRVLIFTGGRISAELASPVSAHDILNATWTEPFHA